MIERECCIAVPDHTNRQAIISTLSLNGFRAVGDGTDCFRFLRTLRIVQPHLAVIGTDLPGNVLETASIVDQECISAVLLVSGNGSTGISALRNSNLVVLSLPADKAALATVAEVLCLEFGRRKKIFDENRMLKNKLHSRTIIERAKGLIMEELSLEEKHAYRILQKRSMELRLPMKDVAEEILKRGLK